MSFFFEGIILCKELFSQGECPNSPRPVRTLAVLRPVPSRRQEDGPEGPFRVSVAVWQEVEPGPGPVPLSPAL